MLLVLTLIFCGCLIPIAKACLVSRSVTPPEKVIETATYIGTAKVIKLSRGDLGEPYNEPYYEARLKPLQTYKHKLDDKSISVRWYTNSCSTELDFEKNEIHEIAIFCNDKNICGAEYLPDDVWSELRMEAASSKVPMKAEKECLAKGGQWLPYNYRSMRIFDCHFPATDARKECNDSSECEGKCLTTVTKEEEFSLTTQSLFSFPENKPPESLSAEILAVKEVKKQGTCSEWKNFLGCSYVVRQGVVQPFFCSR